jgi:hypothetical protein
VSALRVGFAIALAIVAAAVAMAPGSAGAAQEPGRVFVASTSSIADALSRALREELPGERLAPSAEEADMSIAVDEQEGELALSMTSSSGVDILARRISTAEGRAPALRAAILILVEALRADAKAGVTKPAAETSPATNPAQAGGSMHLILSAGTEASWFGSPRTAEIGGRISAHLAVSELSFGVALSVIGTPFWSLAVKDALSGSTVSVAPSIFARWMFLETDSLALGAQVDLSVWWERIEAKADAFVGMARSQTFDAVGLAGRAALVGSVPLGSEAVALILTAGLLVRGRRHLVLLPEAFASGSQIDSQIAAPFAHAALAWRIF